MIRTLLRWAITPSSDPINRACSTIAGAAVLFLVGVVLGVGLAR